MACSDRLVFMLQREEWRDAWLSAEAGEAESALEEALDSDDAWQRPSHTTLLDLEPHSTSAPDSG